MSASRTPIRNGLLYCLVAGSAGALLWTLFYVVFGIPDDGLIAPRRILIPGGALVWCFICFLVGFFNGRPVYPTQRMPFASAIVEKIGWFLYRLFVGAVVGLVATVLYCLLTFTAGFLIYGLATNFEKHMGNKPGELALLASVQGAQFSGFCGGVFGALLGSGRRRSGEPTVSTRAARGSLLGFLFGVQFGASMAWLDDAETLPLALLMLSVPTGILSGLLANVWTDVRQMKQARWSPPPFDTMLPTEP